MARIKFPSLVSMPLMWTIATFQLNCGVASSIGPETCDRSEENNPAILYSGGSVVNDVYMSSPWEGPLLYFPGGEHYEIEHQLGGIPRYWQFYLSFEESGIDSASLAIASGNQAELLDLNETSLTVANESCSEYWLLVVAGGAE